jgi:ubiquinone/menaquinone biosynthesis C-methylase UbiE
MSGVRMGERALQIGVDDARIAGALAAKTGITGLTSIVVSDDVAAARARAGVDQSTAVADVQVGRFDALPYEDGAYDVVIVHAAKGLLTSLTGDMRERVLRECRRVLRSGGRAIVLEAGTPTGLRALLGGSKSTDAGQETLRALEKADFRAVRVLGDRQGYRFIEGLKA